MRPLSAPRRVASVDIGSNTVLLLVVEERAGGWHVLADEMDITRVSEGLDERGELAETAVDRTAQALARFRLSIDSLGVETVLATGTAPFRRAQNGALVARQLGRHLGAVIDVVSGEHEARLAWLAVRRSFPELGELVVLDIGGASTELVFGVADDGTVDGVSIDLGSVRLSERYAASDPIHPDQRAHMREALEEGFSAVLDGTGGARRTLVGVAGTVTTIAALDLGLDAYDGERVHGVRLTRDAVDALTDRLFGMSLAARCALPGLPAKRADVIPAGAQILSSAMHYLGVESVVVSDRGVRWGRLFEWVEARG